MYASLLLLGLISKAGQPLLISRNIIFDLFIGINLFCQIRFCYFYVKSSTLHCCKENQRIFDQGNLEPYSNTIVILYISNVHECYGGLQIALVELDKHLYTWLEITK